jgi:hypothetical protein
MPSLFKQKFFLAVLILLGLGASYSAQAAVIPDNGCFAISGTRHDDTGALQDLAQAENAHTDYRYGGYSCKIFNSYKELNTHLSNEAAANRADPTTGLPEGASILVLQISHGGPNGSTELNSDPGVSLTDRDQLMTSYEYLAKHYHVALINQSCYAGDLMEYMIAREETLPTSPMTDNLCLVTDSIPGRTAKGLPNMNRTLLRGEITLEDYYLANPIGTISSAAWSQTRMADYTYPHSMLPTYPLFSEQHPEIIAHLAPFAENFMEQVNLMLAKDPSALNAKDQTYVQNARYAMNGALTGPKMDIYNKVKTLYQLKEDYTDVRAAFFTPLRADGACGTALRTFLTAEWYKVFAVSKPWSVFIADLTSASHADLASCSGMPADANALAWATWLSVQSDLGTQMMPFAKAQNDFNQAFGVDSYDYDGVVNAAMSAATTSPTVETEAAQMSQFMSAIGIAVNRNEFEAEGSMILPTPTLGRPGATGNVIPAFNLMSLIQPTLANPLDLRRRNACRSIQLKAIP